MNWNSFSLLQVEHRHVDRKSSRFLLQFELFGTDFDTSWRSAFQERFIRIDHLTVSLQVWTKTDESLQFRYIICKESYNENRFLGSIVLMCHQILRATIKRNLKQPVMRIDVSRTVESCCFQCKQNQSDIHMTYLSISQKRSCSKTFN